MQYYFFTKGGVKKKLFSRLSTYYCRYINIIYTIQCILYRLRTGGGIRKKWDKYISALASAPSRPPNPTLTPQNQASSKNPRSKVPKTQKKPGVLTVNIIPISHKSAKIAIFSCQKSRVPNKTET